MTTPKNRHQRRRKAALLRRLDFLDRMTREQAAAYLTNIGCPISSRTLAQYAWHGRVIGPPYSLVNNRAMYERADLDAWAASRTGPKARTHAEHEDIARRAAA
jgi:hypothetical protein